MDPVHIIERNTGWELTMDDELPDSFASVTIDSGDDTNEECSSTSVGFHLSFDQACSMYGWLHAMITK